MQIGSWMLPPWASCSLRLDTRLGVGVLSVGYGVANLIQALPELTPGWLGVIEGSLTFTYAGFGVPAGVAVVTILGYRLVSFWMPVAAGLPCAWGVLRADKRAAAVRQPGWEPTCGSHSPMSIHYGQKPR